MFSTSSASTSRTEESLESPSTSPRTQGVLLPVYVTNVHREPLSGANTPVTCKTLSHPVVLGHELTHLVVVTQYLIPHSLLNPTQFCKRTRRTAEHGCVFTVVLSELQAVRREGRWEGDEKEGKGPSHGSILSCSWNTPRQGLIPTAL